MSVEERQALIRAQHSDYESVVKDSSQQPLSGCEKASLIGKLALLVIATLGTGFLALLAPCVREKYVEIWTQLNPPETDESGVNAVMYARLPERGLESRSLEDSFESDLVHIDSRPSLDQHQAVTQHTLQQKAHAVSNLRSSGGLLEKGAVLDKSTSYAYLDFLEGQYGSEATFLRELIDVDIPKDGYVKNVIIPAVSKALDEGKHFVFVPVVHASKKDHIVLFTINLKLGALEYYDSKGKAPGAEIILALGKSVGAFRQELSYALFTDLNRLRGEEQTPVVLKDLRSVLAVQDDPNIQTKVDGLTSHLSQALTGRSSLFRSINQFVRANPISTLQKINAAFEKGDKEEVKSELRLITDGYKLSQPLQALLYKATRYSDSVEVNEALEQLKKDASTELKGMQQWQDNLHASVDAEITNRGRLSTPFHAGVYNMSNGVQHQKKSDWTNCGVYVAKFMKERIEQSKVDRGESASLQGRESIDFRAATQAIGEPGLIRSELIADLQRA